LIAKYTIDVVSNCVFALDAESFKTEKPVIREMGRRIMDFSFKIQIVMFLTTLFPKIKQFYKFTFVPKDVEEFFIKIMMDAIKFRKENHIDRVDYLDHLIKLQEGKHITEVDMAGHGVSFFADGFETTSLVLSNCLYDLAVNPECQQRLREEINDVCENKGGLTYDNCHDMVYLDQVLYESMRLHPVVPTMAKRCTETTDITDSKDKKIHVDKGTVVVVPLHGMFMDEQYYEEPLKFNPDRFSPENGGVKAYRDQFVFFPFGDGPRMCLGMRFALASMKRGLAEVVKNFEITLSEKTKLPLVYDPHQLLIVAKDGIWLKFKAIKM
jgi:cytochrome P450 family 6/cytochrome P450 family 28